MADAPRISIIIPTLNEAAGIAAALETLRRLPGMAVGDGNGEVEVIVVDGGSEDGTAERAAPLARVIQATRGRAAQLNAGAREARGEWLLFLHADTRLAPDFRVALARTAELGREAGAFRLRIEGRHPLLPLLAWGANLRTRWRGVALGDQALFCTRRLFETLGGFPDLPILEDYVFTLRLRRAGVPLHLTRSTVHTSGRRWDEQGFWRTWWRFRMIYRAFRRDHDLRALAAGYEAVR